ncbi:NHL repeat-containing protein [Paraliomyxa miuraensis]|uniref:hypothetical protein n=1 Tax=Paraliomyxa miuraensis TaxID=376150 RepID=UPI00225B386D|nr:hypothetical protein [Paraliomyxa miuraensis]MCX4247931.1 hypothetical protein [Paraliomyxa miuraensis]
MRARSMMVGMSLLLGCGGAGNEDAGGEGEVFGTGDPVTSTSNGSADGTTGPGTSAATSTSAGPDGTTTPLDDTSSPPIFDVAVETTGVIPGDCCGPADFSYIWIANSTQSTVSKINTRTMIEEGRYATRDTPGNPSRTSVSVDGRAVAVANRYGGIVKIWARPGDCSGLDTSTGAGDIKPWGTDDCVAWYTPFPQAASQRPVAWTTGTLNQATCEWEGQKIWTGEGRGGTSPGMCSDSVVYVHRLDGDTGTIEDTIQIPLGCTTFGWYGGVVDANNDLWLTRLFEGSPGAVRVDYDTLTYETVGPFYGYGITVDHNGRIWGGTGVPGRWDPATATWTTIMGSIQNVGVGLAEDQQARMWVGINGGIQAVDVDTMALLDTVMFAGETIQSKGISVDVDGFIWAVPDSQTRAYKVDPNDLSYQQFNGLVGAYTYSDMTGGALNSVACNPPAG